MLARLRCIQTVGQAVAISTLFHSRMVNKPYIDNGILVMHGKSRFLMHVSNRAVMK